MNVAEEVDHRRYDSAADGESSVGQPAFSPSASPPTSDAGATFSADQVAALRKAYLPLLASGGQIPGANSLQQQQQNNNNNNNASPVPVVTSANNNNNNINNNNHLQRSNNNGSSALPSSLAAMVSALSAVQPPQAAPQPSAAEDALPLFHQQLLESLMQQQQQQQQSLQASDAAGLLAMLGGGGLPARHRPAPTGNFMEMVMAALIGNGNGANSMGDASPVPASDALLSLLSGMGGGESAAGVQPDFGALLAAPAQTQPSFDLASRLANLNNNDSKLLSSSPPAAGANGTDLLGLLGASPDLLGALAGALGGNGGLSQPQARPPTNALFGADFGSLLNGTVAGGGAADTNATLAQFFAASGGANNGNGNGTTVGGFGFANSPSKSLDAYCEICDKTYCNRYFLKTHKQKKHGIYTDDNGGVVASPTKSAPTSAGFFPTPGTSHPLYERAGDKRALRPDGCPSENDGGAAKLPKLSAVATTAFSSASAPPHSGGSVDQKAGADVFDFAEHFQRQSFGHPSHDSIDESALASAAAALFDPSGGSSSSCGASSAGAYGCDMCAAECESNVALLQHKFTAHAAALLPAAGGTAGGGSHGVSDEISPPQSSSSSIAASDQQQQQQPKQQIHHHHNSTGNNNNNNNNNNEIGGGLLSALSQQLPALLSPSMLAQLTAVGTGGGGGGEVDAASLLVAISKLVGLGAMGKDTDGLLGSSVNGARFFGNSSGTKQTTPKRQYTSTSKNYCDVCKKDVCNKYFLRTHMLKMHQIVIDENKPIIAKIDTNEKERTGSIMFRCDICLKEHRTRMELKQHKTEVHGIAVQPARDAAGTPLGAANRTPKSGGTPSAPPRLAGCASVGSTPPPTVPHVYEPSGSNGSSHCVQINHASVPPSGYYEAGSPAGSSSTEKGVTNFLAVKEESDDNGSIASEPNNHINNNNNNNNNNNDILKIETTASSNYTANAEQLEQMLSSIAAAAAAAGGGIQPKPEPSDGGGSAGVSSPSTSSSATFDVAGVASAPAAVSTAPSAAGAVKSESFDRDEDAADHLAGSYGVDVDVFGQLDSYKNLISQLVAASTASNNNNNNNNDAISYGNGGDSGALRSPLLSSLENGELLRQVAMRMQQENQQHCLP